MIARLFVSGFACYFFPAHSLTCCLVRRGTALQSNGPLVLRHIDPIRPIGPTAHWSCRPIGHTAHWCYGSLVLRPIVSTSHWSYGSFAQSAHWSRRPIGPTAHWSCDTLVLRLIRPTAHWSYDPLVLRPSGSFKMSILWTIGHFVHQTHDAKTIYFQYKFHDTWYKNSLWFFNDHNYYCSLCQ